MVLSRPWWCSSLVYLPSFLTFFLLERVPYRVLLLHDFGEEGVERRPDTPRRVGRPYRLTHTLVDARPQETLR